jgi:hypothetical protein
VTAAAPQPATPAPGELPARRGHRAPRNPGVLDLIFKIRDPDAGPWTATLRSDPAVVVIADDGDILRARTRDLALAMLQGHGEATLHAMRQAGTALPQPAAPAGSR